MFKNEDDDLWTDNGNIYCIFNDDETGCKPSTRAANPHQGAAVKVVVPVNDIMMLILLQNQVSLQLSPKIQVLVKLLSLVPLKIKTLSPSWLIQLWRKPPSDDD